MPLLRNGGAVRCARERGLRQLAAWAGAAPAARRARAGARCELCPIGIGEDHRHLLHLDERRIVCVCETCWSMRSGDPEFRPPGARTLWLDDFDLPDERVGGVPDPDRPGVPDAQRASAAAVVALYPSPAGATESELELDGVGRAVRGQPGPRAPRARRRGADRRPHRRPRTATRSCPIDQCYRLVGLIKARWEGITGGRGVDAAIAEFFDGLRARAVVT